GQQVLAAFIDGGITQHELLACAAHEIVEEPHLAGKRIAGNEIEAGLAQTLSRIVVEQGKGRREIRKAAFPDTEDEAMLARGVLGCRCGQHANAARLARRARHARLGGEEGEPAQEGAAIEQRRPRTTAGRTQLVEREPVVDLVPPALPQVLLCRRAKPPSPPALEERPPPPRAAFPGEAAPEGGGARK